MIKVTHAAPILTGIIVAAQLIAVGIGPAEGSTTIIVAADVGGLELIGHTLIGLGGEVHPVRSVLAVVNHHIGNGADTLVLECVDH